MEDFFEPLKKYNIWDGGVLPEGFQRVAYLQKMRGFLNNRLIKVLVGQRRTGKSYILRQIINSLIADGVPSKNIFFLNKEFADFESLTNSTQLNDLFKRYLSDLKPQGRIYVFLDEIQNVENWENFVNSYSQDYTCECEFFISGFNSKMLSGELATMLSGRYVKFEVFPFSFEEYCGLKHLPADRVHYIQYLQDGGLPELFNLNTEEAKRYYVDSLKDTILLRDIIQRYRVKDPKLLADVFTYVVNTASSLLSIQNMVNYFGSKGRKTSYDTIATYLGYLEDTYLIHKVERYDIKGRDVVGGVAKYYVNDLAYHNYLFKGVGYGIGYLMENDIYLQMRRKGMNVYVGRWKDKEVDFVTELNENRAYWQVAYLLEDEPTREREYKSLLAIKDNFDKYVVSTDETILPIYEGIRHKQVWNYCSEI